jgi:hypothetical protein
VTPAFHEIVGGGEETSPEELAALRQVHELLLSAEPPPALSRRLSRPPRPPRRTRLPRGRARAALAVAASAAAAVAFAVGYNVGRGPGFQTAFSQTMHGVGALHGASGWIGVGHRDASGNWPLEMSVRGLPRLPANGWYELSLTKKGEPDVLCGSFRTGAGVVTTVRLNAPGDLGEYTGWIITRGRPGRGHPVLLTT